MTVRRAQAGDEDALAWAHGTGRDVRLHVVEDNAPALALHGRHGFRPTGRVSARADGGREVELVRSRPTAPASGGTPRGTAGP